MSENTTKELKSPKIDLPPEDLFFKMRRIRKLRPRLTMNQERIARDLKRTQSGISRAMLEPETYPTLANEIYQYLVKFESQMQSTTTQSSSHA